MSKITKIILLSVLILTSLVWAINRDMFQGLVLIIFSLLAFTTLERRAIDRNFYLALRKLYLCTDIEGFNEVLQRIEAHAMISQSVENIIQLLQCMGRYHLGDRIGLLGEIQRVKVPKRFLFWRYVYMNLLDKNHIQMARLNTTFKSVPAVLLEIASQRLKLMQLFSEEPTEVNDVITVRDHLTYNLLIAEATYYLSMIETHPNIKSYYLKSANNLIKEFVI